MIYDNYRKKQKKEISTGRGGRKAVKITKNAVAGTLESSDAMVTVEPNAEGAGMEFDLDSVVINQFGNSIRRHSYGYPETSGCTGCQDQHRRQRSS